MKILVVNSGSSSLKYQVIDTLTKETLAKGNIEEVTNHADAIQQMINQIDLNGVAAVGHRVVNGGELFTSSTVVTDKVLEDLEKMSYYAPLHNPASILGVKECIRLMPGIPNILVFDTSFHSTLDEAAFLYGIPYEDYLNYGIRKFGAHGTSHKYVAKKAAEMVGKPLEELKMITCHIGNGASICAIQNGKSIDTSMGMTPLAGLVMGTRSGDIDPSILPVLCEKHGFTLAQAIEYLNKQSGLKGLTGISADMRDIESNLKGNKRAQLGLDVFIRRIIQYVGGYVAQMGGCDVIVFTGGIGCHRPWVGDKVMEHLQFLPNCKKFVMLTNEELEIASECERLLK